MDLINIEEWAANCLDNETSEAACCWIFSSFLHLIRVNTICHLKISNYIYIKILNVCSPGGPSINSCILCILHKEYRSLSWHLSISSKTEFCFWNSSTALSGVIAIIDTISIAYHSIDGYSCFSTFLFPGQSFLWLFINYLSFPVIWHFPASIRHLSLIRLNTIWKYLIFRFLACRLLTHSIHIYRSKFCYWFHSVYFKYSVLITLFIDFISFTQEIVCQFQTIFSLVHLWLLNY